MQYKRFYSSTTELFREKGFTEFSPQFSVTSTFVHCSYVEGTPALVFILHCGCGLGTAFVIITLAKQD